MARKRYSTKELALRELAIDSNSDKGPEDEDFFSSPDGDDFVAESSDEAALDETVYFL